MPRNRIGPGRIHCKNAQKMATEKLAILFLATDYPHGRELLESMRGLEH